MYRIGLIFMFVPVPEMAGVATARAFLHALGDLPYVEGRNLFVELRTLEGRMERASAVVAELVSLKIVLVVTNNGLPTRAAKEVTQSILKGATPADLSVEAVGNGGRPDRRHTVVR